MVKQSILGMLLLTLAGCQAGPDKPLTPLPDKVTALPYGRLLERSRLQATQAIEASYIQNWTGLIEVATGLEETARFLLRLMERFEMCFPLDEEERAGPPAKWPQ